ncbi:MAG TPA: LLM class flavin-dependent oxidoreductase [Acidimicrobiaceae bacterium]|nr:LLM class flavin-dependent oxidoreductase [Acidimicrobiaceae bacterium]HAX05056.1 LLM class flavin-dependent oxidoreductase [Acidimicrobiaceae bacterium]
MIDLGLMISSGAPRRAGGPDLPGGFGSIVGQAQWAEEHGFRGVWVGEGRLATNAVVAISLIAANTKQINIGSGILPYRTRNAALLAVTWKTLDDLAPGRMRLGLGGWWEPLATRCGLPNHRPLKAMREVITVVKGMLRGDEVTYKGEFVDVDQVKFDGPTDDDGHSYPVPIYIGAVRMGMCQLAGEIADGVLLDFLVPPSYNDLAMEAVRRGAKISGRSMNDFDVPQLIAASVDDKEPQKAIDDCKEFLTQYIAQQPHIAEFCGAEPELVARIQETLGWPATKADIRRGMALVSNELTQRVAACGTTSQALDKMVEWNDHGCTEGVITPLGTDAFETLDQLAGKANLKKHGGVG